MDSCFAFQPFNGLLQSGNAPVIDLIKEDVKGRLIKLDDIDAGSLQFLAS